MCLKKSSFIKIKISFFVLISQLLDSYMIHLDERGKTTSPAQLSNLILPICGKTRSQRASEPPLKVFREGFSIFNRQNFYLKWD